MAIPKHNPAAYYSCDRFNRFTKALYKRIKAGEKPLVILEDDTIVPISYIDEDDGYFVYWQKTGSRFWNKDGTSITKSDWNICALYTL